MFTKIAIIGAGNLGRAIAKGLCEKYPHAQDIYLSRRNKEAAIGISHPLIRTASSHAEILKEASLLIVCVQPQQYQELSTEIRDLLVPGKHILVSAVATISLAQLESDFGKDLPLLRAMPNTAIAVGQSMTCIAGNEASEKHKIAIQGIFEALGTCLFIRETQLQAATVLCASGIAFWMRMLRASMQGAIQLGFESKEAMQLSTATCLGAAALLQQEGAHPETEIDKVTTPNGCTITGLNEMERMGLSKVIIQGMLASYKHLEHIGEMQKKSKK